MDKNTFFSVIMPIYNVRKDYLYAAFDSLKKQTYRNYELIIINDGADEETSDAIERYQFDNPYIRIFRQENQGQYISRINGLKAAKGDYVFFFDSDDLLTSRAFETLDQLIRTYQSDVIIFGLPRFMNDESDMTPSPHFFEEGVISKNKVIEELLKLHSNNICSKCAKRELLSTDISDIDTELRNGEDLGQATKLILNAQTFYYTKKDIYLYRDNQEKRDYYDTKNIHNVNFPVPLYNEIFVKNTQHQDKVHLFKASVVNSIIYNAFRICRFNKNKKDRHDLLDELGKQEIISILKNIDARIPLLSEIVFFLLNKRCYFLIDILAHIYPLN